MVASNLSGTMPMSVTTQPKRCNKARRKKRLELYMAPGFMSPGATSPGMTSSSPVENKATRTRGATGNCAKPILAAKPIDAGARRSPLHSTAEPSRTSSPCLRMHWPDLGELGSRSVVPSTTQSSCITTASAPSGIGAPVKIRAALIAPSAWPTLPAATRWLTANGVALLCQSLLSTA